MQEMTMSLLGNLRIRYKLLLSYSIVFILAITLGSIVIYSFVRKTIEANIESELKNSTSAIFNMVKTSAAVSIKNHLRAVAEKNQEIAEHFFRRYKEGVLSEEEAKAQASTIMLSQTIGKTGYIYCLDSDGVVVSHPKKSLIGVNVSNHEFVREQKSRKEGYIEYDWKNPGEVHSRPKALYMSYFSPWDWIISVSSYREEFNELVNVDDFRDTILSLRFGKTGYSYVTDSNGNTIIHPKLQGINIFKEKDISGEFFKEMLKRKSGKIIYSWKNPGEDIPRKKLVIFNYIPEFKWIVASSSYLEEFYAPLESLRNIIVATVFVSLLLVLPITFRISSSITKPVQELMSRFAAGATGDFTVRMERQSQDEVGRLASYFNTFMEKLEAYSSNLEEEIRERKQTEEALRLSEEMFSKAFRSSPNGISIATLKDGRFINVNNSFLSSTGYSREEIIGKTHTELKIIPSQEERFRLMDMLEKQGRFRKQEIIYCTKSGNIRMGVMSAEIIELWDEPCMLSTIEDVTEAKRLEREILDISERERQKIGQDLHDDLCPHLIGIEVLSKVLNEKLEEKSLKEALYANKIRSLIKEGINKTRTLARGLCPVHLVAHGLESSLEELARNVEEIFGISCIFKCSSSVLIHDNTVATHLFYIVQEAVHNAIKHGKAEKILIDLSLKGSKITLKITDNGQGMPKTSDTKGMGLRIMSYRAKMIGALLDVRRDVDGGTIVLISLRNDMGKAEMRYERK